MKSFIAMFLLIFSIASCGPKSECDCAKCAEVCKVEAAVDSTAVEPAVEEVKVEENEVEEVK